MIDATVFEPKIYVICLATYTGGKIHGAWIDASQKEDAIQADIQAMLANSPILNAKSWEIGDCKGFGGIHPWYFREYNSIKRIVELVSFFKKNGDIGRSAFVYTKGSLHEAQKIVENHYCGEFFGEEDYALYVAKEIMEVSEDMLIYIDLKKMVRDLSFNYLFINSIADYKKVHVFHC